MKKIYKSVYCLDYLHLIKNLFKNIIFFHKYEELFQEFNELCSDDKVVNIFNNFIGLYETNIPQLKEIVIELIILLPLKTRQLVTKFEVLSTPLIDSLSLPESSFILRGLKTLDVIISSISQENLEKKFIKGKKQLLIRKLYHMLWDLNQKEIQSSHHKEICIAAAKVLGKLGHNPRTLKNELRLNFEKEKRDF